LKTQAKGKYSQEEALAKARKYCALQERCSSEVKAKLFEWCEDETIREEIINQLLKENFLSEFRYADLFTRSKINQKKWGRLKIQFELQQRFLPAEVIEKAFKNIDENQYLENLLYLKLKKEKETNEPDEFKREMKIKAYLATKGYEYEYINKVF
jgi:regulatory protein